MSLCRVASRTLRLMLRVRNRALGGVRKARSRLGSKPMRATLCSSGGLRNLSTTLRQWRSRYGHMARGSPLAPGSDKQARFARTAPRTTAYSKAPIPRNWVCGAQVQALGKVLKPYKHCQEQRAFGVRSEHATERQGLRQVIGGHRANCSAAVLIQPLRCVRVRGGPSREPCADETKLRANVALKDAGDAAA